MGYSQKPLINFVGFQCYWWSCILLQNQAIPFCILLLALHLYFHDSAKFEIRSLCLLAASGFIIDGLLTLVDFYQFDYVVSNNFPPLWLAFLWLGFATNITTLSQFEISKQWGKLSLIGAAFAPLSYLAAAKFNAVTFPHDLTTSWLALVIIWLVLMPALFYLHKSISESFNAFNT